MYAAYETLREANRVRQAEWDSGGDITLSYAGNELAGEVGEAIEADDMRDGAAVSVEVADVIICCDLIANNLDLPLEVNLVEDPAWFVDRAEIVAGLAISTGAACNVIKKLERERFGMPGSRATTDDLMRHLADVVLNAHRLAHLWDGANVGDAVAKKFNATSKKVGLRTRLLPPEVQ